MYLLFKCALLFWLVLDLVTSLATPLYIYFQVLCQVLASNGRESKSYDMMSRKQILYPSLKNSQKITRSSFWSKFFARHAPGNYLDFISFEFSDLSNRIASINSSSADCLVLADCILVFQSYLLKVFNLGYLLKVPWFELSNNRLWLFWIFLIFFYYTKVNFYVYVH